MEQGVCHPRTLEKAQRWRENALSDRDPRALALATPVAASVHSATPRDRVPPVPKLRTTLFAVLLGAALTMTGCDDEGDGATTTPSPATMPGAASTQKVYECPMHCVPQGQTEEHTSDRPGDCPVCGMSLRERE